MHAHDVEECHIHDRQIDTEKDMQATVSYMYFKIYNNCEDNVPPALLTQNVDDCTL